MGRFTDRLLKTMVPTPWGPLYIKGLKKGVCGVHEWPTRGLAKKLIQAMKDRHPKGVNACRQCIDRAVSDAARARGQL